MIRTSNRIRICATLILLNLCFIWGNSLLPGEISGAFSEWVREMLAWLLPSSGMEDNGGGLLRKAAHFTEFAALGTLLSWLFAMLNRKPIFALTCGAAAACVDETIQRFVPDRGPSILDVGIDTCGVVTGIVLLHLGYHIYQKRMTKR